MKTTIDYTAIFAARNKTRRQYKIYLYEAERNILAARYGSVSDAVHALVAAFLKQTGAKIDFLKDRDVLKIKEIRRAITDNQ